MEKGQNKMSSEVTFSKGKYHFVAMAGISASIIGVEMLTEITMEK